MLTSVTAPLPADSSRSQNKTERNEISSIWKTHEIENLKKRKKKDEEEQEKWNKERGRKHQNS